MVWVSVRVQPNLEANPHDFEVTALRRESGEWVALPLPQAAEAKSLVLKKCPGRKFFIAQEEVKLNVTKEEFVEISPPEAGAEENFKGRDGGDVRAGLVGKEEVGQDSELMMVVLRFAKTLAQEIVRGSKAESAKAEPSVFRGLTDKVPPETWLEQFEFYTKGQESFEKIMMLREFVSGVARVWYDSAMAARGSSSPWSDWRESFLLTFASDHLREAELASKYTYKEESGSLVEYLLEKQRLVLRANPETTDRSMVQAILLGLPFYLRQQFKLLRSNTVKDIMENVSAVSERFVKKDATVSQGTRDRTGGKEKEKGKEKEGRAFRVNYLEADGDIEEDRNGFRVSKEDEEEEVDLNE